MKTLRRMLAMRTSAAERVEAPADGSLVGVVSAPGLSPSRLVYGVALDRRSCLLVFVIHAASAARDAAYWDRVIASIGPPRATGPVFGYWGICDSGDACAGSLVDAQFTLVSRLDLYEMRGVALADDSGDSLLYRGGVPSAVRVPRAPTPEAESKAVLQAALASPVRQAAPGAAAKAEGG